MSMLWTVQWSVPMLLSVDSVSNGYAVCPANDGSGRAAIATTSARVAAVGEIHGMVVTPMSPSHDVQVLVQGQAPRGFFGTGTRSPLVVNSAGLVTRGNSGLIVGWTDASGNGWVNFAPAMMGMGQDHVNVCAAPYGLIPDDNSTATKAHNASMLQAAIDDTDSDPSTSWGRRIYIPRGKYYLSSTITIRRRVHLYGDGGAAESAATMLAFNSGIDGIVLQYDQGAGTGKGDWAKLENFTVLAVAKAGVGMGIRAKCIALLRGIGISGFAEDGLRVWAGDFESPPTSASFLQAEFCRITNCSGYGVNIDGSDSSACVFIRVDVSACTSGGYRESSQLGNTYVGCHAAACAGPGYFSDIGSDNASLFLGCYMENDCGAPQIGANSIVVGGSLAGYTTTGTYDGPLISAKGCRSTYWEKPGSIAPYSPVRAWTDYSANMFFALKPNDEAGPVGWTLGHIASSSLAGSWAWNYSDSPSTWAIALTGPNYSQSHNYTGRGHPVVPHLLMGDPSALNSIDWGSAAPTTGTWRRGDIRFNTGAGPTVLWRCDTAGTPGTWRAV